MAQPDKDLTEAQKKAATFLTRKRIPFEPKSPERLAAEARAAAEEELRDLPRRMAEAMETARPGDEMPDGTVYIGRVTKTGKQIFAMPADEPLTMSWNKAMKAAAEKEACGHQDWRLPDVEELDLLYTHKDKGALKGTFNTASAMDQGWYWSSIPDTDFSARDQHFYNGQPSGSMKSGASSVRLVRG